MSVRALSVLPAVLTARREDRDKQTELENEVIALFEEFRTPLLRYSLSFGLAIEDAEEVIQEVFLSLFEHLQRDKPRHNLRSWLFRVAHNLGLKRRYRVRRELKTSIRTLHPIQKINWSVARFSSASEPLCRRCRNKIAGASLCGRKAYVTGRSRRSSICLWEQCLFP